MHEDSGTFQKINLLFLNTQVLTQPGSSKEYFLQTDALDKAFGGHLLRCKDNGDKSAVAYLSQVLQPAETRFNTT